MLFELNTESRTPMPYRHLIEDAEDRSRGRQITIREKVRVPQLKSSLNTML